MITKEKLQALDIADLNEYYQTVLEKASNGETPEVKFLISELSEDQGQECMKYIVAHADKGLSDKAIKTMMVAEYLRNSDEK